MKGHAILEESTELWLLDIMPIAPACFSPPSSMIEMSSLPTSYRFTVVDQSQAQVNPGPPELLAQLFWTGASLLESDFPSEYAMALRLLTKVQFQGERRVLGDIHLCCHYGLSVDCDFRSQMPLAYILHVSRVTCLCLIVFEANLFLEFSLLIIICMLFRR